MGILLTFLRQMRQWDLPTKIAFAISLLLMAGVFLLLLLGPEELRQPAAIGIVGLLIVTQIIVLWGNRHMVTPYTLAQRQFMAGDFDAARNTLVEWIENEWQRGKKPPVEAYVLLGNTYRQLGDLEHSEEALHTALQVKPSYHFPLYGLGRTLLAQGKYSEASRLIEQALQAGAPPVVRFDLAHALYRAGRMEEARELLQTAPAAEEEPHRTLMTGYLLHKLNGSDFPDAAMIEAGLAFWQAEARRFEHTVYGQAVLSNVQEMQSHIERV